MTTVTTLLAWTGGALAVLALFVKTMIPLRMIALGGHICFLAYGLLSGAYYVVLAYGVTLPVNVWRLIQMKKLVSHVQTAADGDLSVKWLHPFMKETKLADGAVIFKKGDPADHIYYLAKGTIRLVEINQSLETGQMFGEIGFFSPKGQRSLTAICSGECLLYRIGMSDFKQLYYQNPDFGFYVVRLIARRLTADIERLEAQQNPRPQPSA